LREIAFGQQRLTLAKQIPIGQRASLILIRRQQAERAFIVVQFQA